MIHDAEPHPGERRRLLDLLVRSEARASDRVVTLSNHVADQLLARGAPPGKLIRLFHPVFRFGAGAPPASRAAGPFRLLFFGRILPYKGVPMLLEAFASLRRAGAKCVLRVVGRGRDTAPAELEHQDGVDARRGLGRARRHCRRDRIGRRDRAALSRSQPVGCGGGLLRGGAAGGGDARGRPGRAGHRWGKPASLRGRRRPRR